MDKTDPSTAHLAEWLAAWWRRPAPVPKTGFVLKNGPGGPSAMYVEWPRLIVCLEGARPYWLGPAGNRRIVAGQALYFAPGVWLSPLHARRFRSLGVHWEAERVRLILREESPFAPPRAVWSVPRPPGAEPRLAERIAQYAARPSGALAAEALLLLELGRLIDGLEGGRPSGRRRSLHLRMCAFLEEHFARPHSRESVAAHFGISTGHLTRIFREEGGRGFNGFLNDLRLREAEALLGSTSLTVQEIALQCGFTDPAYFSRLFRRRHGAPPGRRR